ncbi:MAG: hypothetical protein LBI19_09220 [Oscillospiraceae bacterium]|jgi:hypothetical protein|nr:hypothetical protein [Oscillospiraceae bacterium]
MVTAAYFIDTALYDHPDTRHNVSIITKEYTYKEETLAHMRLCESIGTGIEYLINTMLIGDVEIKNEYFIVKNTYDPAKWSVHSRDVFDEKMKRFDLSQTALAWEIVEMYAYIDKKGCHDEVKIVIMRKEEVMTAVIDFKDEAQCADFTCPPWLMDPQNSPAAPQYIAGAP